MCRKFGQKMGLTAERCASPKCAFTRRQSKPGVHGQKRRRARSEYGEQLLEKQRVRVLYGVPERALKQTVRRAIAHSRSAADAQNVLDRIAAQLELRLDNVVFRLGLAPSRAVARQMVSHGHVTVNGRKTTVPSFSVRPGARVAIRPESIRSAPFAEMRVSLGKRRLPSWLTVDPENLTGAVSALPPREEMMGTVDLTKIVEFYAR